MQNVVVVGANGYSGEELCRLVSGHPHARLVAVTSRQWAGRTLEEVLPRLGSHPGVAGLRFTEPNIDRLLALDAEYFFLALPHGLAAEFAAPLIAGGRKVVDLSADFRLRSPQTYLEFYGEEHGAPALLAEAVFGLPELYRKEITQARLVASAGCYPTSILLPLVPLLRARLIEPASITISSASGVSGAGRKAEIPYLYGECNESLRAYGLPKHRHLSEIEQELSVAADSPIRVTFVPHLAPMTRGIHTTIFAEPTAGADEHALGTCLERAYADEAFVRLRKTLPDTKLVNGTNYCDIAVRCDDRTGRAIVLSALDNLVKGAAGQAVQNFNLMAGIDEIEGLIQ